MQIFYTTSFDIEKNTCFLTEEDSYHCIKVLRKKEGEKIYITDGKGHLLTGTITNQDTKKTFVTINEIQLQEKNENENLTIAIAPTKNMDRMEWFVEKATEIGIGNIIPILTERGERDKLKTERLHKIAISAMKQSKNYYLPNIFELTNLKDLMQHCIGFERFVAHCGDVEKHLFKLINCKQKTIVLIGPEGDFTQKEIDFLKTNNFQEVNLGETRLRTETAGLAATMIFQINKLSNSL